MAAHDDRRLTDDDFGRMLGDRLRQGSSAMPAPLAATETARRARRVRRNRRIAGLALGAAVVLGIGGGVYGIADPARQVPSPAGPITAVPSGPTPAPRTTQSGPRPSMPAPKAGKVRTVSVRLDQLSAGDQPDVDTVQAGVWHKADGSTQILSSVAGTHETGRRDYTANFLGYDGGDSYAAGIIGWIGTPGSLDLTGRLYSANQQVELGAMAWNDGAVAGPQHGPRGSIMWETKPASAGVLTIHLIWGKAAAVEYGTHDAQLSVPVSDPQNATFVAGADSIFVADAGVVTRYQVPDLTAQTSADLSNGQRVPGFTDVETGFPAGDTVVLSTENQAGERCEVPVDATKLTPDWAGCIGAEITTRSPDGRYYFGYDDVAGSGTVYAANGRPILRLTDVAEGEAAFDDHDRLTLIGSGGADDANAPSALVVCTLDGTCHRASQEQTVPLNSGQTKLSIVSR